MSFELCVFYDLVGWAYILRVSLSLSPFLIPPSWAHHSRWDDHGSKKTNSEQGHLWNAGTPHQHCPHTCWRCPARGERYNSVLYLCNCDFAQKLGVSKLKIPLPRLWSLTRRLHHIRRCRGCVPLSSDFEPTAPKDMLQHTGRITRKARVD